MTDMERLILDILRQLNRELGRVFSYDIAAEIEERTGRVQPVRTVRHYLPRLEQAKLVRRPNGKNSGWVAA